MSKSKVVHVLAGQDYDVYVGREMPRYGLARSVWANPYTVGADGSLAEVLRKYRDHVDYMIEAPIVAVDMSRGVVRDGRVNFRRRQISELSGKTLACWCAPKDGYLTVDDDMICHGQILHKLAEELS